PSFSKDGGYLAWTSMSTEGYEADKNDIMVMDMKNPNHYKQNLTRHWDGTVNSFEWDSNNSDLFFTAAWQGTEQLFFLKNPGMTKMMPIIRKVTAGKHNINSIVGVTDDQIIVTKSDMNHANEIYSVKKTDGSLKQLTHENDGIYSRIKMSNTELKMMRTTDGKPMGVWVI